TVDQFRGRIRTTPDRACEKSRQKRQDLLCFQRLSPAAKVMGERTLTGRKSGCHRVGHGIERGVSAPPSGARGRPVDSFRRTLQRHAPMRRFFFLLAVAIPIPISAQALAQVTVAVDPTADVHPISPLIYGVNFPSDALISAARLTVARW